MQRLQNKLSLLSLIGVIAMPLSQLVMADPGQASDALYSTDLMAQAESAVTLINRGDVLFREALRLQDANDAEAAWDILQEALAIYQSPEIRQTYPEEGLQREAQVFNGLGELLRGSGNYDRALEYYGRAIGIQREIADNEGISTTLNNIGAAYQNLENFEQALTLFEEALALQESINNPQRVSQLLNNIGTVYDQLGQYESALLAHEEALTIRRETQDLSGEATTLGNIGAVYSQLGQYDEALNYYQAAVDVYETIEEPQRQALTLSNMGVIYEKLSQYERSLEYYQAAFRIQQDFADLIGAANSLNNLGSLSEKLGQYEEAIGYFQVSLEVYVELGNRQGFANTLNNIGLIFSQSGQPEKALDYYRDALKAFQEVSDLQGAGTALHNLGTALDKLGRLDEALQHYQEALAIRQSINDLQGEGSTYSGLGVVYQKLGQNEQALAAYQKAVAIRSIVGDRRGNAITFNNLGYVFADLGNPELAIIFFKQSVNEYEAIREDIRGLPLAQRQSFTNRISHTYRKLADLLLSQDRIPEAQQVLDLLKLEELRKFTDTRAVWVGEELRYTAPEQRVINAHGSLVALGNTLVECERINCGNLDTLYTQQESLLTQYDAEVARFIEAVRANRHDDDVFQTPDNISGDAQVLLETYAAEGQAPILIYPFVLEDKLWLVWVTVGDVIGSVEVPVSQETLAATVQRFGALLQDRNSDIGELQATSQQLYNWIIEPLVTELDANNIDHLVFVNDRVTRYIPMAALYNGDQYLVERYTLSTVLLPSATNLDDRLATVDDSPVLGLGLTQAVSGFNPLPAVSVELNAIIQDEAGKGIYPGQVLLDEQFTLDSLKANVGNHRILHMATHAEFIPGRAEESYIVLGDGSQLKISDIETMQRRLRNLHLVVLSACQTALGGANQDGTEIAGLSSYFLEANRAEAVLASLWSVSDGSTSLLMQQFYENLASGEYSKAQTLRQAQLALLHGDLDPAMFAALDRGIVDWANDEAIQDGDPTTENPDLSHPYYWAPFILIGNGL